MYHLPYENLKTSVGLYLKITEFKEKILMIKKGRALKETYKIFSKIYEEKLLEKPEEAKKFRFQCPCCQYVIDRKAHIGPEECKICPLVGLWPDGCERWTRSPFNEHDTSLPTPWERYNISKDLSGAKEIADYCLKLILK
jgi:hypothetical protein